ncbi:MAG TPA: hypothetical protein VMU50_21595, partial [Polyangia bacterium]|nr:hypothetical protein [Polyangia bacterium]
MKRSLARRTFLRGAGVALSMPWMESLAPRGALAQSASRLRYLPIFLPCGAAAAWRPPTAGQGTA